MLIISFNAIFIVLKLENKIEKTFYDPFSFAFSRCSLLDLDLEEGRKKYLKSIFLRLLKKLRGEISRIGFCIWVSRLTP